MRSFEVERYDESELVERASRGDQAAFTELVRAHQHEVYTLAVRMVADRELAYDVAQRRSSVRGEPSGGSAAMPSSRRGCIGSP